MYHIGTLFNPTADIDEGTLVQMKMHMNVRPGTDLWYLFNTIEDLMERRDTQADKLRDLQNDYNTQNLQLQGALERIDNGNA